MHHCIQSSLRPVLPWSSQPQEYAVTSWIHVCVRLKRCPWKKYGDGVVKSGGACLIGGLCLSLPMQKSCLGTLAGDQEGLHSVLLTLLGHGCGCLVNITPVIISAGSLMFVSFLAFLVCFFSGYCTVWGKKLSLPSQCYSSL